MALVLDSCPPRLTSDEYPVLMSDEYPLLKRVITELIVLSNMSPEVSECKSNYKSIPREINIRCRYFNVM